MEYRDHVSQQKQIVTGKEVEEPNGSGAGNEIKHITINILGPCFSLSVRLLVSARTRISTVAFSPKQKEFCLLLLEIHTSLLSVFSSHSKHKL